MRRRRRRRRRRKGGRGGGRGGGGGGGGGEGGRGGGGAKAAEEAAAAKAAAAAEAAAAKAAEEAAAAKAAEEAAANDATALAFEAALLRLEGVAELPPAQPIGARGLPDAAQLAAIERHIERLEHKADEMKPRKKSILESFGSGLAALGRSLRNVFATPDAEKLEQLLGRLEALAGDDAPVEKVGAEGVPDAATIAKLEAMVARLEAMAPDEA